MPSGFQVPEDSGSAPPRMPHPVRIPVLRGLHREYSPYAVPGNTCSRIPGMKISFLPLRQHRKQLPPLIFSYLSVSCFIPRDRSFLRTVTHSSFEKFSAAAKLPCAAAFLGNVCTTTALPQAKYHVLHIKMYSSPLRITAWKAVDAYWHPLTPEHGFPSLISYMAQGAPPRPAACWRIPFPPFPKYGFCYFFSATCFGNTMILTF